MIGWVLVTPHVAPQYSPLIDCSCPGKNPPPLTQSHNPRPLRPLLAHLQMAVCPHIMLESQQPPIVPPYPTGAGPPPTASCAAVVAPGCLRPQLAAAPPGPCPTKAAAFAAAPSAAAAAPPSPPLASGPRVVSVRGWRLNGQGEDIDWLLLLASPDGSVRASTWQGLYSVVERAQWEQVQCFLLPQLTVLRSLIRSMLLGLTPAVPMFGMPGPAATGAALAADADLVYSNGDSSSTNRAGRPSMPGAMAGASVQVDGGACAAPPPTDPAAAAPEGAPPTRRSADFVHDWRLSRTENQVRGPTGSRIGG